MDLFNRRNLTVVRTHQTAVWRWTDEGHAESVAEVFIRGAGGVHYLAQPYTGAAPALTTLYYDTYLRGVFSARPYCLQHMRDGSVVFCVLALIVSCCKAWNLDSIALLKEARPSSRVSESDCLEIKQQARWEGTVFPGSWDTPAIDALCQSLTDIDCRDLAALLAQRTVQVRGY
jgi:hypothetical protein